MLRNFILKKLNSVGTNDNASRMEKTEKTSRKGVYFLCNSTIFKSPQKYAIILFYVKKRGRLLLKSLPSTTN